DFDEIQLLAFDLTGDGIPEIIVHNIHYGASWTPSHMAVFAWRQEKLANILQLDSGVPLDIENLKKNGRYQIINTYEIGNMYHAAQPRWSDIYAYKNGRFVQSNRDYPEEFRHWKTDLKKTLEDFPKDKAVWEHLGQAYEILGESDNA